MLRLHHNLIWGTAIILAFSIFSCKHSRPDLMREIYGNWFYINPNDNSDNFDRNAIGFNDLNFSCYVICREFKGTECPVSDYEIFEKNDSLFLYISKDCEFCGIYYLELVGPPKKGKNLTDSLLLMKPGQRFYLKRALTNGGQPFNN